MIEAARTLSFKGMDPKKCYPVYLAVAFEYYEGPNDVNRALFQEDDSRGWAKENMPGLYRLFISQLISRYSMTVHADHPVAGFRLCDLHLQRLDNIRQEFQGTAIVNKLFLRTVLLVLALRDMFQLHILRFIVLWAT